MRSFQEPFAPRGSFHSVPCGTEAFPNGNRASTCGRPALPSGNPRALRAPGVYLQVDQALSLRPTTASPCRRSIPRSSFRSVTAGKGPACTPLHWMNGVASFRSIRDRPSLSFAPRLRSLKAHSKGSVRLGLTPTEPFRCAALHGSSRLRLLPWLHSPEAHSKRQSPWAGSFPRRQSPMATSTACLAAPRRSLREPALPAATEAFLAEPGRLLAETRRSLRNQALPLRATKACPAATRRFLRKPISIWTGSGAL